MIERMNRPAAEWCQLRLRVAGLSLLDDGWWGIVRRCKTAVQYVRGPRLAHWRHPLKLA